MGFLDKAKEKAGKLVESTKEKVDDIKDKRKADELLDDLGRITYRQRTERAEPDDEQEIARLVSELQALEAEGTEGLTGKKKAEADTEPASSFGAAPSPGGPSLPPAAGGPTLPGSAAPGGPSLPPAAGEPSLPPQVTPT